MTEDLSKLVNELLIGELLTFFSIVMDFNLYVNFKESHGASWTAVEFDFLIEGEFLRLPLIEHIQMKDISTEATIDVEYIERYFYIS